MAWLPASLGLNSTSLAWRTLADSLSETTGAWAQVVFDHLVIPVGSFLLQHTERAVQYTLNGDYEAVQDATRETLTSTLSWLDLTTFQVKLLREFFVIFLGNSLLVLVAWSIYGARIRNKFMSAGRRRGSTRRTIEELRTSRSELKLPQEMDFKFK